MNKTINNQKVMGVVLAGGRSSRMGEDKALLKVAETTMIARSQLVLEQTSVNKVVISRNDGKAQHVPDIIADKGPLSGIHSMVMRYPHYHLIVLPVDLPFIDARTLQQLITSGQTSSKNTHFKDNNLPLYIHNTANFRKAIDNKLRFTQSFSVGSLCQEFPLLKVSPIAPTKMFNTNTPEQWRFALRQLHKNQINYQSKGGII